MILRIAMIGFGNVGQEFARLLLRKREWLLKKKGLDVEVLAIATRSKGSLLSKKALDLESVLKGLETRGDLRGYGPEVTDISPLQIIDECDADVMVELTTLNIESGQPAIDHISNALQAGLDVITANKGPVAFAYDNLRNIARSRNVRFRFEGTVMDGTPVFSLVERTLPGCEVLSVSGILNSTSNFILDEMAHGESMDGAVRAAQRRGFAEADPSMDIDGWDASAKITALANVLMGARATPKDVDRKGIRGITQADIAKAAAAGMKYKLVAEAKMDDGRVRLTVSPQIIGPENPFWSVDGTSSAITFKTDLMGDITVVETNPSITQTAYAVFSDLLLTVESIRSGTVQ